MGGIAGRTTQDVVAETYERDRIYGNPRLNPYPQNGNAANAAAIRSAQAYQKAAREAFRTKILATQTQQDLTVSKVIDGDTLEVSTGNRKSTLHIIGTDAPEEGQPGWEEAKNKLSDLVMGKIITIKYSTYCPRHASGVFLTRVIFEGNDVGTYMLKSGSAWYDENYEVFFEEKEHKENIRTAKSARSAKLGIWKNGNPAEPWVYAAARSKKTP